MFQATCVLSLPLIVGLFVPTQAPWHAITDGPMTFSMPCTGKWDIEEIPKYTTTHRYTCGTADETFLGLWTEYAPLLTVDAATELRGNRDIMIANLGAVLLTHRDITFQGLPGLEFTADVTDTYRFKSRALVQGRRLFTVVARTRINQDHADNVARFFDSLRIKN